jgi:DNA-binding NtrC family response regulator
LNVSNRPPYRLVGSSPVVAELQESIVAIAPLPFTVYIHGEAGTGKELIAQELHRISGRTPLVTLDCAVLTGELFASELFGHDRGAFTGAFNDRVGLVEVAGRGTIFLDEIGELERSVQSRLLRFLQDKEFRRLGSNRSRTASCRIIAATNRNLAAAVEAGTFRADLYERLHVLEIKSPPLRERIGDLEILMAHFADKHNLLLNITPGAMQRMYAHSWPGNIRELEHLTIHLGATCATRAITEDDMPAHWDACGSNGTVHHLWPQVQPSEYNRGSDYPGQGTSINDMKLRWILQVVNDAGGQLARAAKILGIGRTTLYRQLQKARSQHQPPAPTS